MIAGEASQARSKVLSRSTLSQRVADARAHGVRIVFTNGCLISFTPDISTCSSAPARSATSWSSPSTTTPR